MHSNAFAQTGWIQQNYKTDWNVLRKKIKINVHLATCHPSAKAREFIYNNNNDADRRITDPRFFRLADEERER